MIIFSMKKLIASVGLTALTVISVCAQQPAYKWASLPFGCGGFVSAVVACPEQQNLFYARTDVGGAYRWNEEDGTWIAITDFLGEDQCSLMGVESLAIDPSSPNRLFLYCGTSYWNSGLSAILYSEDYGDTFRQVANVTNKFPANGNGNGRQSGEMLAVSPSDGNLLLCGSRSRGLWRSGNGGRSWQRVAPTIFPNDVKVAFVVFVDGDDIVVGMQCKEQLNLYRSADSGQTWTAIEGQTTQYMPHRCTLAPDHSCLYITYTDDLGPSLSGSGCIMKYDLTDGTWKDISPANHSFGQVSVAADNPQWLLASTMGKWNAQNWNLTQTWGDQLYVSKNGGRTWTNLMERGRSTFQEHTIQYMMQGSAQLHWCGTAVIDPFNHQRAFFTSGQGIFMTENLFSSKPTFCMAVTGLEETVPNDIVSIEGGPLLTAVGDNDGCLYQDLTAYTNRYSPSIGTTYAVAVGGEDHEVMMRSGDSKICLSTNGGQTWRLVTTPDGAKTLLHCAVSAKGTVCVVCPKNLPPQFSLDQGQTWSPIPDTEENTYVYADPLKDDVFYATTSSRLIRFNVDVGTGTFTQHTTTLTSVANKRRPCVVGGRSGELWVARGNQGLYHITGADGDSPRKQTVAMSQATCVGVGKAKDADSPPALYVWGRKTTSQDVGIYRSDNEGKTWTRVNDNRHQFGGPGNAQLIVGDMNEYGRVYLSTAGRGVITGWIDLDDKDAITPQFATSRPQEPTQRYSLSGYPIPAHVQTKGIYIVNGRKVIIK